MTIATSPLARFFDTYQRATAETGASAAALFAATFVAAGPDGARAVPAAGFGAALDKRKELFARLGCQPSELGSLEEIPLDDRYALARTQWRFTFRRAGRPDEELVVKSTFLVDLEAQKILVYLAHQDMFAILRERGLLHD